MKAFFRKHRFKILVTILSLILIYVCFYILWVHIPYTKHQNELTSIQESICDKYNYTYNGYFNEYQNKKTNYIVKVKNKKKNMYVLCNTKLKKVDTYKGNGVKRSDVKEAFYQKYHLNCTKIEVGYENEQFVYCLTYKGKDTLLYAYYSLDNGEFLKAYRL